MARGVRAMTISSPVSSSYRGFRSVVVLYCCFCDVVVLGAAGEEGGGGASGFGAEVCDSRDGLRRLAVVDKVRACRGRECNVLLGVMPAVLERSCNLDGIAAAAAE